MSPLRAGFGALGSGKGGQLLGQIRLGQQAVAHFEHPFTPGIQLGYRQAWRGMGAVGIPGLVGLHQVGRGFETA